MSSKTLALFALVVAAAASVADAAAFIGGASSINDMMSSSTAAFSAKKPAYAQTYLSIGSGRGIGGAGQSCVCTAPTACSTSIFGGVVGGCLAVGVSDDPLNATMNIQAGGTNKWTLPLVISTFNFYTATAASVKLTAAQAAAIYKGAPPAGLPKVALGRSGGSGTTQVVQRFFIAAGALSGVADAQTWADATWKSVKTSCTGVQAISTTALMCQCIAKTPGSIGYAATGICDNSKAVKEALVQNKAGNFVGANPSGSNARWDTTQVVPRPLPLLDASWSGVKTVYQPGVSTPPIASFEYFIVKKKIAVKAGTAIAAGDVARAGPSAVQFMKWVTGVTPFATPYWTGAITVPQGFLPAPGSMLLAIQAALKTM